jgi:diguanylate cyclase (GGDEF)-like protein
MLAAPIPKNESARLESLRQMLLSSAPDEASLDRVTRAAHRIFGTPIALISLVDRDRLWFKSCIGLTVRETPRNISFCGHAILEDEPLIVEDTLCDPRFADNPLVTAEPKIRFYAGRPLRNSENFAVGALCIIDREPRTLSQEERRLLDDLGLWAEAIFASRQLSEAQHALQVELQEAKRESMVDPLLHIWNRCAIVDILDREAKRAERHHAALSALMVDVDHLAAISDRYGQPAADAMLKEVARAMHGALRPYDAVGRYGTAEFLVVLPDTDRNAAAAVAERLRKKAEACTVAVGSDRVSSTVSTGAASVGQHAGSSAADTLVAAAADALLLTKQGGRERVEGDKARADLSGVVAARRPDVPVLESTDDDLLGNALVAAQLARLRACVVDD